MSRADVYLFATRDGNMNEQSHNKVKRFAIMGLEYEDRFGCSVGLLSLRFACRRCLFASFSCAYKREVAHLQRDTTQQHLPPATVSSRTLRYC